MTIETDAPPAPKAPIKPKKLEIHGHTRVDDYFWLRDKDDPEVIAYIEAENAYTQACMDHTAGLQETLYQEMVGRIQESDKEAPVQRDEFWYYSRTEAGKQYPIFCRTTGSSQAPEEVLLDLNALAAGKPYLRLGIYKPSPDHRLLAYSLDEDGSENYAMYFKNLETGDLLPDVLEGTSYSGEWANDNRTFFYTTKDPAWRDYRLLRHILREDQEDDLLLYEEADALFEISLQKTRDQAFIFLNIKSLETSEIRFLDANHPGESLRLLQERRQGIEYGADHHRGIFYIWTNQDAKNFQIVTAPVSRPGMESWQTHQAHDPQVKIDGLACFSGHLAIYMRKNGLKALAVQDLSTGTTHEVDFPEPVYTFRPGENPSFDTQFLRLTYASPITPDSDFDYDMVTRQWHLRKRKPVLGGFDPQDYEVVRLHAAAEDGAQIPISLFYRKGLRKDGSAPCLLYGYGAYGYSIEPGFNMNAFCLVDRGFVYAIAHIRGGQELGRDWYERGKFLHKKNTFTDFVACARHLINQKFTAPERLAIEGRSAGGLLIGAVLNLAPELFKVAVAGVPFVDVVTTMLDESIPLTVGEFEEWGNPKDPVFYEYMHSYSPYDNLAPGRFPHILATSGLNDPRVQYWEPTKWVARLRRVQQGEGRVLLKTNMGAGHAGASGRYDYLREKAFEYAYILDSLGLTQG